MEKLYKKPLKEIIVSLLAVIAAVCTLLVIIIKNPNDFSLIDYIIGSPAVQFYTAMAILILLAVGGLALLVTIPVIFVKRKGQIPAFFIGLIVDVVSIILALVQSLFGIGNIILLALGGVVNILGLVYSFLGLKFKEEEEKTEEKQKKVHFLPVLIINVISALALLMIFFIPVLTYKNVDVPEKTILMAEGFRGTGDPTTFAVFIAGMIFIIVDGALLFNVLSNFFYNDIRFVESSKRSMYFCYAAAILFFVAGVTIVFIYQLDGSEYANTTAYIPFLIYSVLMVIHCILNGRNGAILSERKTKIFKGKYRWILFAFITVFTVVTFVTLKLPFLEVKYFDNSTPPVQQGDTISITGFDVLGNKMGEEFVGAAFVMFAVVLITGIVYVLALMAFITKNSEIKRFGYAAVVINFMFVLAIGLFGKYFQISEKINIAVLEGYIKAKYGDNPLGIDLSGLMFSSVYSSKVGSQCLFMVFADVVLAAVMLIVKPISKCEEEIAGELAISSDAPIEIKLAENESLGLPVESNETIEQEKEVSDTEAVEAVEDNEEIAPKEVVEEKPILPTFDACPAFSEIDEKKAEFEKEMEKRRAMLFENPTLPSLTQFIVDYAREDEKHLSYTPESIATFLAGLGATRLSILQGMSGTGKTSLPMIFCKALMGTCDVIPVESSWKDKNELLGYYNEFSKTYTPKAFTRSMYKAAMNPDVLTLIVLDEMNLSRIEYYFSDFLSTMEKAVKDQDIQLVNVKLYNTYDNERHSYAALKDEHTLHIPSNVWFIGTANRDESTFEISDKVYDRAATMNFDKRAESVRNYSKALPERYLAADVLVKLLESAQKDCPIDLKNYPYISEMEKVLRPYNISFGNRIEKQIKAFVSVYAACFNNSPEAIDYALEYILLSKVVRKLEFKTIEDKAELAHKFEKLGRQQWVEFVNSLNGDL